MSLQAILRQKSRWVLNDYLWKSFANVIVLLSENGLFDDVCDRRTDSYGAMRWERATEMVRFSPLFFYLRISAKAKINAALFTGKIWLWLKMKRPDVMSVIEFPTPLRKGQSLSHFSISVIHTSAIRSEKSMRTISERRRAVASSIWFKLADWLWLARWRSNFIDRSIDRETTNEWFFFHFQLEKIAQGGLECRQCMFRAYIN